MFSTHGFSLVIYSCIKNTPNFFLDKITKIVEIMQLYVQAGLENDSVADMINGYSTYLLNTGFLSLFRLKKIEKCVRDF